MRVLFLESDHRFIFGLPLGFRDLGHKIRVSGEISEEKLNTLLSEFSPDLLILLGWTTEHSELKLELVRRYKEKYNKPLIYWATEDPTFFEAHSLPLIRLTAPDYVFTVSFSTIEKYKSVGIKASQLPFAYQPTIFYKETKRTASGSYNNSSTDNAFLYKNCLIANAYPNVLNYYKNHYRRRSLDILINPLLRNDIRLDVWGKHWDKMNPYLAKHLPASSLHGTLHYLRTHSIYNSSDNVICLQNYSEDVITMRTYEILGSGSFMYTSYNHALTEIFKPESDFIHISSPDEMLEKYSYYEKHQQKKEEIRINAQRAVANHTYKNRANTIIKIIEKNPSSFIY